MANRLAGDDQSNDGQELQGSGEDDEEANPNEEANTEPEEGGCEP